MLQEIIKELGQEDVVPVALQNRDTLLQGLCQFQDGYFRPWQPLAVQVM